MPPLQSPLSRARTVLAPTASSPSRQTSLARSSGTAEKVSETPGVFLRPRICLWTSGTSCPMGAAPIPASYFDMTIYVDRVLFYRKVLSADLPRRRHFRPQDRRLRDPGPVQPRRVRRGKVPRLRVPHIRARTVSTYDLGFPHLGCYTYNRRTYMSIPDDGTTFDALDAFDDGCERKSGAC